MLHALWLKRTTAAGLAALAATALVLLVSPEPWAARRVVADDAPTPASADQRAKAPPVPSSELVTPSAGPAAAEPLDPAAWGTDHVEAEVPEYVEGGECLFCHRNDVGPSWQTDPHSQTVRDALPEDPEFKALLGDPATTKIVDQVKFVMGGSHHARYLRRGEAYGHLDLLSVRAERGRGTSFHVVGTPGTPPPAWDTQRFAERCAGCHSTAVEPESAAFASVTHDCFVCHGDATVDHSTEPELMPLAKARKDPPRVVTSICASCHLRGGASRATGRPYPTNFVAGDNLFRDFEVDFSQADDPELNPGDRHVWQNVRDVVVLGNEEATCLSCHQVHGNDTTRHRQLPDGPSCRVCHAAGEPLSKPLRYTVHSAVCEY